MRSRWLGLYLKTFSVYHYNLVPKDEIVKKNKLVKNQKSLFVLKNSPSFLIKGIDNKQAINELTKLEIKF